MNRQGSTSGPKVDLELLKEKMDLRLPVAALDRMLQGEMNADLVSKAGDHYYCNLQAFHSAPRGDRQREEEPKRRGLGFMTERDLQARRQEERAAQQAAFRKLPETQLKQKVQEKEARILVLMSQPTLQKAEEEELELLNGELASLQENLRAKAESHQNGAGGLREVDATHVEEDGQ